jgi:hypothetical protein
MQEIMYLMYVILKTAKPKVSLLVILAKYFGVLKSRRTSGLRLVACMGQKRSAYRNFISKTKRNRSREKPSHRRESNIPVYLKRNKIEVGKWIYLAQDRNGC